MVFDEHDLNAISMPIGSEVAREHLGIMLGSIAQSCGKLLVAIDKEKPGRAEQLEDIAEKITRKVSVLANTAADDPVECLALIGMVGIDLCATHAERLEYARFMAEIDGVGHEG